MNIGLVVNARGMLCLVHDEPFDGTPQWVGFDEANRRLEISFGPGKTFSVEWEVNAEMHPYLLRAEKILLIQMQKIFSRETGFFFHQPVEGYETSFMRLSEGQAIRGLVPETTDARRMSDLIGHIILHYHVLSKIGEGGMGQVYKANDLRLGRNVAIKFLKARFDQRWEDEAIAIATINDPNVVTLYDVGKFNGQRYLVMEFLDAAALKGPISSENAIAQGLQITRALAAAHSVGIVHRDLKPSNCLLTKSGLVKVVDFGLARKVDNVSEIASASGIHPTQESATLPASLVSTLTKGITGTPGYVAPELLSGSIADARSDIFAVGCILYEILTGRAAFSGPNLQAVLRATLEFSPELSGSETPKKLRDLIALCLSKDPDNRPQRITEVQSALEQV